MINDFYLIKAKIFSLVYYLNLKLCYDRLDTFIILLYQWIVELLVFL